jgi:hypothetical protein
MSCVQHPNLGLRFGDLDLWLGFNTNTMRNHIRQNHITLQLKFKKQLKYNCYATIHWVLQLLCNYSLRNMVY